VGCSKDVVLRIGMGLALFAHRDCSVAVREWSFIARVDGPASTPHGGNTRSARTNGLSKVCQIFSAASVDSVFSFRSYAVSS
jgi:hypothetical protein